MNGLMKIQNSPTRSGGPNRARKESMGLADFDWSMDKVDGSPKEVVYIDGGTMVMNIWGQSWHFSQRSITSMVGMMVMRSVQSTLETTELHILIMLNADGNDFDTRWNVNQVDLNRNYDHTGILVQQHNPGHQLSVNQKPSPTRFTCKTRYQMPTCM